MVIQCKEIRVFSQRRTPCCLPRSYWDWNLITIYLNKDEISFGSFTLSKVLLTTLSSLLAKIQSRDSVSSAVKAWPKTVPSDFVNLKFLLLTDVSLDSRFSSSINRESSKLYGTSYLIYSVVAMILLTRALPSSSIPITWYWSLLFFLDAVDILPSSFVPSNISLITLPESSKSLFYDLFKE